ncbi:MAG: hypothetical protein PHT25_10815 [Bacteroidales bacterium]|nr:hypothetical protein [Bacteroidales bacterium]
MIVDARNLSLCGFWLTDGKHLYYEDNKIVTIKKFTPDGTECERYFSKGRGPEEMLRPPRAFKRFENGDFISIDIDSHFFYFDSLMNKKWAYNFYKIGNKCGNEFKQNLLNNPDPDEVLMYELSSYENQVELLGDNIIFPVTTEHIKYNGFYKESRAKEFYKDSYHLMALNKNTLKKEIFGKFPPIYHKHIWSNFMDCHITKDDSLLYVSFEADYQIYLYNKDLKFVSSFGVKADNVDHTYPERNTFEEATDNYKKDRTTHGFYSNIYFINNYLFRIYHTKHNKIGMQVYSNQELIYDKIINYEIFEMIGYIEPYYYVNTKCDIDKEIYIITKLVITKNET